MCDLKKYFRFGIGLFNVLNFFVLLLMVIIFCKGYMNFILLEFV